MHTRNSWELIYHFVFGTKNKAEFLSDEMISELQIILGAKAKELRGDILACNGHKDHLHILVAMPPRISVSELAKHLKGYSSRLLPELIWQRGYGAFTVDRRSVKIITQYIQNQKEHHAADNL